MTWLVALAVTVMVFLVAGLLWRGRRAHRLCGACGVELVTVARGGEGPNGSYDVLACPRCPKTVTLVHGLRSDVAYCPACKNRSLEVPTVRLGGQPPKVGVREHCHLCGHDATFTVAAREESSPTGKVIPFPSDTRHRRSHER